MKFLYIKHYGARVRDDFVAKKITKLNVSNVYSMYQMFIQCILIINIRIVA